MREIRGMRRRGRRRKKEEERQKWIHVPLLKTTTADGRRRRAGGGFWTSLIELCYKFPPQSGQLGVPAAAADRPLPSKEEKYREAEDFFLVG